MGLKRNHPLRAALRGHKDITRMIYLHTAECYRCSRAIPENKLEATCELGWALVKAELAAINNVHAERQRLQDEQTPDTRLF